MAGRLILLTGATGHVGYRILVEALRAGYQVRAAVRRESAIADIKATASIKPFLEANQLDFVLVQDITVDGAYDRAIEGVDYVVHVASPLPASSDDREKTLFQPAIRGTLSILYSSLKESTVQRVVITGSVASVLRDEVTEQGIVVTPDSQVADPTGPYANDLTAYKAAKIMTYSQTQEFISREKPSFSIIHVMPTYVVGKNELATTPEAAMAGSNMVVLGPLLGVQVPTGYIGWSVHVDDVAKIHIESLNTDTIKGNQNFGTNSNGTDGVHWDDAIEVVKKHFPREVEEGIFPLGGSITSLRGRFDASRTEEVFGFKFKSFEDQVINAAAWYAEVAAKVRANA